MKKTKPFPVTKRKVWEAWNRVKANQGGAGIDGQSIADFEAKLEDNLYKLWNRMASGSYHPKPVRRVEIPNPTSPFWEPTVAEGGLNQVLPAHFSPFSAPFQPYFSAIW